MKLAFKNIIFILLLIVSCNNREWDNPFDPGCPKEIFTPNNFTAIQEGEQIILSWNQTNPNITGFKIERQIENENFSAIASPGKNETSVTNDISAGGKLHTYKLYAMASSNKSNEVTASITPVLQAAVTTKTVTEITATSALSGGTITDDGGGPVTARGVVWNKTGTPTLENNSGKTTDGSGTGSFTSELTGLEEGTEYFVRAYATNSMGTVYGNEVNFETNQSVSLATVTTVFFNLTVTGALVGGNIVDDGNSAVTERGICWIWEPWGTQPTKQDSFKIVGSGPGEFNIELFYLESNTNYYVRAYAINEMGISYGETINFKTARNLQVPTVYTSIPREITTNSALLGGQIMDNGDTIVTERGIVYSLSENPTTADNKVTMGSGDGIFSGTIDGLEPNTTYYVRAYATNSEGTGYGGMESFTTSSGTQATVTDFDGNVYQTVTIGDQVWMAENLKTTKYNDGKDILNITDNTEWSNLTTDAYCWYNNDIENKAIYGALYNWFAVNTGKLCPTGWHVPTDFEWKQLEMELGLNQAQADMIGWRGTDQGTYMKYTNYWTNNGNGINSIGFSALPGGFRTSNFFWIGDAGYWWSSTERTDADAWIRILSYVYTNISRNYNWKYFGFSVRCVKD
jgi:uncharacterized protein (TIGR02145 family)